MSTRLPKSLVKQESTLTIGKDKGMFLERKKENLDNAKAQSGGCKDGCHPRKTYKINKREMLQPHSKSHT